MSFLISISNHTLLLLFVHSSSSNSVVFCVVVCCFDVVVIESEPDLNLVKNAIFLRMMVCGRDRACTPL